MSDSFIPSRLSNLLSPPSRYTEAILVGATAVALGYTIKRLTTKPPLALVPGPLAPSCILGNFEEIFSHGSVDLCHQLTVKYGDAVKLAGPIGVGTILFISDPLGLHHMMKELDIYHESPFFVSFIKLVFGPGILSSHGEVHRRQRKMLAPIFTIPYLRELTPSFYHIARELRDEMIRDLERRQSPDRTEAPSIDMISWFTRVALELIGQAGLGHRFGALEGKEDIFNKAAKDFIPALTDLALPLQVLPYFANVGSASFRRRVIEALPFKTIQRMVRIIDDMDQTTSGVYNRKKMVLKGELEEEDSVTGGKDLLTNILKANEAASPNDRLPEEEVKAQLGTLLFAANDTTSGALARIIHLLASHPHVQDRLREEIIEAQRLHNGNDLEFHDIDNNLPYLDAVIKETLRVHAPVPAMIRVSTKDDVIPLHYPLLGSDRKTQITSIVVPKGTMILLGLTAANRSTKVWGSDAGEWKPERWLSPLPESVAEAKVPSIFAHLATFMNGGKSCIGYKFSILEMKVVLFVILQTFKFSLDSEQDIEWHTGPTMTPHVVGDNAEIRLPLKVELC